MKKVIIIGGGFAGLSAAVFLISQGYNVKVFESAKKLGGRAYSFYDEELGTVIDNGQHIMMGCYRHTLQFLSLINARDKVEIQDNLSVNFVKPGFKVFPLTAAGFPYPLNLLKGILFYRGIHLLSRLKIIALFTKLALIKRKKIKDISLEQWLIREKQSKEGIKGFWEILAIGALNCHLNKASAGIFINILKEIFLTGKNASSIILPKHGLTDIFCPQSVDYITNNGGEVVTGNRVSEIIIEGDSVAGVRLSDGTVEKGDYYIPAVPLHALQKIIDTEKLNITFIPEYSTILTIHIKLRENKFGDTFYALIDSPVHWVFNKGTHLTLVISDANGYNSDSGEQIFEMAAAELSKYLNINKSNIKKYKVIKEKRATFVPGNDTLENRPNPVTQHKNLILAGDWINTGLPATIEGAVKSGRMAADVIINSTA